MGEKPSIRNNGLKAWRKECGMGNYGVKAFRNNQELWAIKALRKECGIMG
jgi:hypothetical protein